MYAINSDVKNNLNNNNNRNFLLLTRFEAVALETGVH